MTFIINDGTIKLEHFNPISLFSRQQLINVEMLHLFHGQQMETITGYFFGNFQYCKQKKLNQLMPS